MSTFVSIRSHQFAYFDPQLGHPDWSAATVLDFGGNAGNILFDPRCTIDHEKYWCVDVSRDAIELGKRRHPQAHFVFYDRYNFEYNPRGIPELPVPDLGQRFDIILGYSVFTHTSRAELRTLVAQLRSLLAEDGVLAFTFIDPDYDPPAGWARDDETPGLDNLMWRLTASHGHAGVTPSSLVKHRAATVLGATARRGPLSWATLVNHEELVIQPSDDWIRKGHERSQYISFCTEEHMRSIYPDAEILPPVRPQRHSCCLIRNRTVTPTTSPGTTNRDEPIVVVRPLIPDWSDMRAALYEVFESQVLTNDGPRVRRLEALLSAELGIADLAVTGSGTTAIQLACAALGLSGEVLVPAAAFPAVAQAVLRAGATPVTVDIEDTYLTIDPAAVRQAITPRTCAILAVHTFGCPADVDALHAIAREAGIPLVFDASTCWGVNFRGRPLLSYGDVSTLSLHATKLTHSIEGGAVLGNTRTIADSVRGLRSFGTGIGGAAPAGTNAKMSELHAAVGAVVLREATAEIERRSAVRELYRQALADVEWLRLCDFRPDAGPNVAALPVRLTDDAPLDAEQLCRALLSHNVQARAYFAGRYRVRRLKKGGPTPRAELAAKHIVCLPFWGRLTENEISRVAEAVTVAAKTPALLV